MKLTFDIANKIKLDFQHLIGQKIQTNEGQKEIKEITVLPIVKGSFGTFPLNYLMSANKQNFISPHKNKEMSLIIYFTDNSFITFFELLKENKINFELSKYTDD